jgi:hypothetical protein
MVGMPAVAMKKVHQRAGQQQQVNLVVGDVAPLFAQQVEAGNGRDHQKGRFERTIQCRLGLRCRWRFVVCRHLDMSFFWGAVPMALLAN